MEPSTARLEVVAGKGAGMSVLVVDELLIGRNAEGAGRLADDDEISRSHARISIDSDGRCVIEDLASTNGTFVNRRRISEPQLLAVGDTVELGATMLVVRDLPTPVAPQPAGQSDAVAVAGDRSVTVEPTVIGASISSVATPDAPAEPEIRNPAPTQVQAPPEVPTPAPTQVPAPSEIPNPAGTQLRAQPDVAGRATPLALPPLSLGLEVDFDAGEARIALPDASEPIRLVFSDGSWRPVTPS